MGFKKWSSNFEVVRKIYDWRTRSWFASEVQEKTALLNQIKFLGKKKTILIANYQIFLVSLNYLIILSILWVNSFVNLIVDWCSQSICAYCDWNIIPVNFSFIENHLLLAMIVCIIIYICVCVCVCVCIYQVPSLGKDMTQGQLVCI